MAGQLGGARYFKTIAAGLSCLRCLAVRCIITTTTRGISTEVLASSQFDHDLQLCGMFERIANENIAVTSLCGVGFFSCMREHGWKDLLIVFFALL